MMDRELRYFTIYRLARVMGWNIPGSIRAIEHWRQGSHAVMVLCLAEWHTENERAVGA